MFTGIYRVSIGFSLQYLRKTAVRIAEKPHTPQRERLCMLWGNLVIQIVGKSYIYHRVSPQPLIITGFPHNIHNLSL
jgi:hypothetical protein